jgi:GntR family transcriptional regulator / MocR family aminotransferase
MHHDPALIVGYATPPGHAFTTALARLCAVLQQPALGG